MISTRRWLKVTLIVSAVCCLSVMTGCAQKAVVIPDSREIIDLSKGTSPRPGWYGISGGYLREIYRDCGLKQ